MQQREHDARRELHRVARPVDAEAQLLAEAGAAPVVRGEEQGAPVAEDAPRLAKDP